jgi:antitoxin CptB
MDQAAEQRRVYWHSRRGMLELDLLLMPFAEHEYPRLQVDEQRCYRALLAREDVDIFAWVVHRETPTEPDLARIVARILAYGRAEPGTPP